LCDVCHFGHGLYAYKIDSTLPSSNLIYALSVAFMVKCCWYIGGSRWMKSNRTQKCVILKSIIRYRLWLYSKHAIEMTDTYNSMLVLAGKKEKWKKWHITLSCCLGLVLVKKSLMIDKASSLVDYTIVYSMYCQYTICWTWIKYKHSNPFECLWDLPSNHVRHDKWQWLEKQILRKYVSTKAALPQQECPCKQESCTWYTCSSHNHKGSCSVSN